MGTIKITVEGKSGTGKSTVLQLIREMLVDNDFNASNDVSVEPLPEESYSFRRRREKVVAEQTDIILIEKQTPRSESCET